MAFWQLRDNLGGENKQHLYWRNGNGLVALSTTCLQTQQKQLLIIQDTSILDPLYYEMIKFLRAKACYLSSIYQSASPSFQNNRNSLPATLALPGCSAGNCWHTPNSCCRSCSRWPALAGFPGRAAGPLLPSGCCQLIQRWLRKRWAQYGLFW